MPAPPPQHGAFDPSAATTHAASNPPADPKPNAKPPAPQQKARRAMEVNTKRVVAPIERFGVQVKEAQQEGLGEFEEFVRGNRLLLRAFQ